MAEGRLARLAAHITGRGAAVGFRVAVLGAAGGIGQPLALLLKKCPLVRELHLYDVKGTAGVVADLSHINTPAVVRGFEGNPELARCLKGCDLVLIPAGVPRKPGMLRDDLFKINAGIVATLTSGIADACPKALIAIISNPVNSTVPIAAEILKRKGCYDPDRLFGVTTLDVVRANTFVAGACNLNASQVNVPVIGGHSGKTILPLLSQASPKAALSDSQIGALTTRIQNAGTEVVEAKAGTGSATLSMAAAAFRFGESCLRALSGKGGVVECAYIENNEKIAQGLPFFAVPVRLGRGGVSGVAPLGALSSHESRVLDAMRNELGGNIKKGQEFGRSFSI
eukprot:CAMPEP_0198234694 /NCGR_PEP_ID=MMETSP1446-20131203/650_1 /TAXON_ID=1461542 ORGANISM="Unidentified sp, Strain CCMP2111" /NCGR_SAMPLE_ID=MMETSP1446 /ASSEMBLY_ACC=CAM_ASM_001112 /LENGTH=339 /DNA_ID=CAMNT_0043915515 /DNA_START=83 /DNA_END=1102 /DNA_ORIENTATION=-